MASSIAPLLMAATPFSYSTSASALTAAESTGSLPFDAMMCRRPAGARRVRGARASVCRRVENLRSRQQRDFKV